MQHGQHGSGTRQNKRQKKGCWQRRTLPPRYQGSTIRARELNFRVRYGSGCTLTALATNSTLSSAYCLHFNYEYKRFFSLLLCFCSFSQALSQCNTRASISPYHTFKSPRPLVPLCYRCYHPSTCGLSSWLSSSGLTLFKRWGVSS